MEQGFLLWKQRPRKVMAVKIAGVSLFGNFPRLAASNGGLNVFFFWRRYLPSNAQKGARHWAGLLNTPDFSPWFLDTYLRWHFLGLLIPFVGTHFTFEINRVLIYERAGLANPGNCLGLGCSVVATSEKCRLFGRSLILGSLQ